MVISTRGVPAVIMVIKSINFFRTSKLVRLFKTRQSIARRPREPIRTLRPHSSIKTIYLRRSIFEGDYIHNYHNVEISMCDVFAVITVIKPMKLPHSPKPTSL